MIFAKLNMPLNIKNNKVYFISAVFLNIWFCSIALSQESNRLWINAGFYSQHFETNRGLRNANPGIGMEYVVDENLSTTAGGFINSDNAHSRYVGAIYKPWQSGNWRFGGVAAAFNGYPRAFNGGWFPAVLPVATWESGHSGLNVVFVPPLQNRLYGAISFQYKMRFVD